MPVKIYWLHNFDNDAKLGIMARPWGGDRLEDDIINVKNQNVNAIVSPLEPNEVNELDLRQQDGVQCRYPLKKAPQIIDLQGLNIRGGDEAPIEHLTYLFTLISTLKT